MKKLIAFILIILIAFGLIGCNSNINDKDEQINENSVDVDNIIDTESVNKTEPKPEPIPEPVIYSAKTKYVARAVITLQGHLKDPSSMEIHKITFDETSGVKSVHVDVSANTAMGGKNRKTYFISDSSDLFIGLPNMETLMYIMEDPLGDLMIQILTGLTNKELDEVFELINIFDETKDKSVLF